MAAKETLLVELLTEELPPKALPRMGAAFADGIAAGLRRRELADAAAAVTSFATPRRLAVSIEGVLAASPARTVETKLMPVSIGLDANGGVTPVLAKKLAALGISSADPATFKRRVEGKSETLFADVVSPPLPLEKALQEALDEAISGLPIPKLMSYQLADGQTTVQFVRPAHGLVALYGEEIVRVRALGLDSGRVTQGHRFQGKASISLAHAREYAGRLESEGGVIANFAARRDTIRTLLTAAAVREGASLGSEADLSTLLDEVSALVEQPAVYVGRFEPEYLAVPPECLVLTMRANQKYFPLFDAKGALTERFLIVSNMRLHDATNIVRGNERVVRPRLADARFFFETDRKTKLANRLPALDQIVYQRELGSLGARVQRLQVLARQLQERLPGGQALVPLAGRAALLCKADLVTLMVGEFPELQGIMGKYYSGGDGEAPEVVEAMEQHYWPRFAGDHLPKGEVSIALALADRLDHLAGMFSIGQVPSGEKDPFALRRAALGVIRILAERKLPLDVAEMVGLASAQFAARRDAEVMAFVFDRLRGYMREQGFTTNHVEAVVGQSPTRFDEVRARLEAVVAFAALPQSEALAAANKRVLNILTKSGRIEGVSPERFVEDEERRLYAALRDLAPRVRGHLERADFTQALRDLAGIRPQVDAFFDKVLVNAEDEAVRRNRLGLLNELGTLMNRVADISKLTS